MNTALVWCFWLLLASWIFFFLVNCFVSAVYTHPITTLHRISSLRTFTPRLIPRSLQFFVVISMRCLIALRIGRALAPLSPCLTAPPHPSICSRTAAWLTYGGISTLLLWVLPGPGGMAVWPLILTFLVFRFHWCPLFPLVVLSLVLSQIIVVYVSTTADAIPPDPGLWKLNISILNNPEYVNLISRHSYHGATPSPAFPPWQSGGMGGREGWGEGSHDPSLLPEVQGPVASPGPSGPADWPS